jgi:outer membrane protein, multidrug efflux system
MRTSLPLPGPTDRRLASPGFRVLPHVTIIVLLGVAGCASQAPDVPSPSALPESFSASGNAPLQEKWWTTFGDAQLDSLVETALQDNLTLRASWDRLDAARALAARSGAALTPTLDGSAGASRTVTRRVGAGRDYVSNLSLGLAASYELDIWGRVRATRDAAVFDACATREDLQAAAVTLTSNVATTWYQLVQTNGELALLDQQVRTNQDYLEVITARFRRGQASATDVLQQRQLIESTRGERLQIEAVLGVLKHQLAILLGKAPGSFDLEIPGALPTLPQLPETGLLAEWVRRRPDVRAAELRVQSTDREVAVALADRFPRLTISAHAETSAERVRDLFDNWAAGLGANLVAPLLDGGRRAAEVERTRAMLSESLNAYGQTVLTSLGEVENALVRETRQAEYVASLREQLALSKQSTQRTLEQYTKGNGDFTRYLTTLLADQALQRRHLQARGQLVLYRIALHRALAGSWELPRPPRAEIDEPVKQADNSRREEERRPEQTERS